MNNFNINLQNKTKNFFLFLTTDAAKNMLNTAEILDGTHFTCFAHILHNTIKNGIKNTGAEEIINKVREISVKFRSS